MNIHESGALRVPSLREGALQTLAGQAGLFRDPSHALGSGNVTDRSGNEGRVAVLHDGLDLEGDILGGPQALGRIVGEGFEGHQRRPSRLEHFP